MRPERYILGLKGVPSAGGLEASEMAKRAGYRTEVIGSLLRPDYLVRARRQVEAGDITAADFKAIETAPLMRPLRCRRPRAST